MKEGKTQKTVNVTVIVLALAVAFISFGCKKSQRETAEQEAIERHQQQTAPLPPPTGPKFARLKSQWYFLNNLHTNGLLPGVSKNLKGLIGANADCYITPEGGSTQEVVFFTHGKPRQDYYYLVGRASSNSPWHIYKAWHTNEPDKTVTEYPVP
ncbi:MAG TPA: hypothetical protein VN873_01070 [Candidatus Angelobacter sp.]|nr:hypothetical protein [Candidatus Angelobacter sp.]